MDLTIELPEPLEGYEPLTGRLARISLEDDKDRREAQAENLDYLLAARYHAEKVIDATVAINGDEYEVHVTVLDGQHKDSAFASEIAGSIREEMNSRGFEERSHEDATQSATENFRKSLEG